MMGITLAHTLATDLTDAVRAQQFENEKKINHINQLANEIIRLFTVGGNNILVVVAAVVCLHRTNQSVTCRH